MTNAVSDSAVNEVTGAGVSVRGDEMDTDRIIPARYLKTVTFDGLEQYVFGEERSGGGHPFDDERYQQASILIANKNFGCGSSREHAPQALTRWGIKAFVAESFAEIFFGNCVSLGLPCVTVSAEDAQRIMEAVEADASLEMIVDVNGREVRFGSDSAPAGIPDGTRDQFVKGTWDALGQLLDNREDIDKTAASLPYLSGFKG